VANSSRITWFVGLQRTIKFSHYSLAPLPNLPGFRRARLDHAEIAACAAPDAPKAAPVQHRSAILRPNPAVWLFASKPTVATRDYLPGRRLVPPLSQPESGPLAVRGADLPQAAPRSWANKLHEPGTVRVAKRVGFPAGGTLRTPQRLDFTGSVSATQTQFAPIGSSSDSQGLTTPTTETSTRQTMRHDNPRMSSINLPPVNARQTANESFIDSTEAEPPDPGGSEQGIPQQHRSPAASTLHIDGAALGRWTIEHLARTLGKPTTGMTGVDPRLTLPRSRVQPF
jgi:hypothetical protein